VKADLIPQFKLWISTKNHNSAFGEGKYRLLKAVKEAGSLKAACEELKISYRKAWGDLKKAESRLVVKLVQKIRGGRGGGNTLLTRYGEKLVQAYSRLRKAVEKRIEREFKHFQEEITDEKKS
jgi:molybdate transport system regulatory protein